MSKNYYIIAFSILMGILLGLTWWHTGNLTPPSGPDAIWFNGGLFALLLGKFVTEYKFTKPNDVFLNCVAVFVAVSTLSNPPHADWWEGLRWTAAVVGAGAIVLAWDAGQEAKLLTHPVRAAIYQIVTQLGRAQVLFSVTFILALISYFDLSNEHTKVFVIAWGGVPPHGSLEAPGRQQDRIRRALEAAPSDRCGAFVPCAVDRILPEA